MDSRQLIDYLPDFLKEFRELKYIMAAEQMEIDGLNSRIDRVLGNMFLDTADEYSIAYQEKMYGLQPLSDDTLEERRFRLSLLWKNNIPYTMNTLRDKLNEICSDKGNNGEAYEIMLNNSAFTIAVKIAVSNVKNYNQVSNLLKQMCPANLMINISVMYNQHKTISKLTYNQLKAYTHNQIRNEVL